MPPPLHHCILSRSYMTPLPYIAYHCPNCGFSHESTVPVYSRPVKCPSCGADGIRPDHPRLPTNSVSRDEKPQSYHFGSDKKTIQVYLRSLDGKSTGVCLDENDVPDCDEDPVHVAEQVLKQIQGWIYHGGLPKLQEVVASMKANAEKSDTNARANRINELKKSIVCDCHELSLLSDQ